MYEHYLLDNPPKQPPSKTKVYDPEYGEEEPVEHYEDPDFDEEWNKLGMPEEEQGEGDNSSPDINNPKEWEEV